MDDIDESDWKALALLARRCHERGYSEYIHEIRKMELKLMRAEIIQYAERRKKEEESAEAAE